MIDSKYEDLVSLQVKLTQITPFTKCHVRKAATANPVNWHLPAQRISKK